jgi:hypothetical protein
LIHPGVRIDCRVKPGNDESKAACSWPRSSAVATQRILLPVRRLEDRRGVGEPDAGVGVLKTGEKYAKFNIPAVNGLKYLRINSDFTSFAWAAPSHAAATARLPITS